ncbi:hypothetical protein [Dolichospermum sp. LEGE 00246]|uniref:hypothetical protein n=1 Tax=Dolichospermum sp. LEGE 00246 TaxID=1828605 RepID=UPI00187E58BE|nr:hypothetical protein [Dolichospermum sp. LEGE 00246]MBE9257918.1 hypothetical protein [Dolichospermum sp. LEGE 00246]
MGYFFNWNSLRELHKKDELLVLLAGKMPAPQGIFGYFFNWKSLRELHKKDELLVLLAGKMPAPQEILGYFFIGSL